MINAIIFSKDRAAQLKLLLDSIEKNAKNIFEAKVIHLSSDEEYEKGYEKLIEEYPQVKWMKQTDNFKADVMNLLEGTDCNYSCFFTDDDILYRTITEEDLTSKLEEDKDVFCFSTRLGKNTTRCYTMNADNIIKPEFEDDRFIKWDWSVHYLDFGYPLSVDGHIFRTNEIKKLTKRVQFENPNKYEAALQMFDNFPRKKMWAYKQSALVNSPSNVVQDVFPNRKGETHGVSTKELNDAFLSGSKIMLDKMDFTNIVGCHQELELPLSMTEVKTEE